MDSQNQSIYKNVFKANALFGGVQLYQILIQVIRSKFIAVLLGPTGIGIQGLYTSATRLISDLSAMGLSQSAVRDISEAFGIKNVSRISRTVKVLRRLIWMTGILGAIVVFILSPILSKTSFGNYDHTIPFIVLSITLLLDQLCSGQKVVLQGTHRLKDLARASAIGSTIGLVVSLPLYYWFGVRGIVPTLVLQSVTALLLSWYFSRKVKLERVNISYKETIREGAEMLKLGLAFCFSSILASLSSYVLRSFINNQGSIEDAGLYVAGFAIVNTYVGMIFTAISTDYYPRLAAVNSDNEKCRQLVNKQGEIATLIMSPLLMICVIFMPIVVEILYSDEFSGANFFIIWAVCGMLFKLASWIVGFLFIAKAESKIFVINELLVSVYGLFFSLLGYAFWGLTGLGIAFLVNYLIYSIQVFAIARVKYGFHFTQSFTKLYTIQLSLLASSLLIVLLTDVDWKMFLMGSIVIILSCLYSIYGLNERTAFIKALKKKMYK